MGQGNVLEFLRNRRREDGGIFYTARYIARKLNLGLTTCGTNLNKLKMQGYLDTANIFDFARDTPGNLYPRKNNGIRRVVGFRLKGG